MQRRQLWQVVLGVAVLLMAMTVGTLADAPADEPLVILLEQYHVQPAADEDSEEVITPLESEQMSPTGAVVEYRLMVKNMSEGLINDLVLGLPVPGFTEYLDESAQFDKTTALLQCSIDGGETFRNPPIRYVVEQEDGTKITAIATPDMYTDLRLVFLRAILPDEEVTVTYRVVVR